MRVAETWLLTYLLNALWQVPLVFAAAWVAARAAGRNDPALSHRIWVAAILLQVILPACSFHPIALLQACSHFVLQSFANKPTLQAATVSVAVGPVQTHAGLHTPPALLDAAGLLYLVVMLYFAFRLAVGIYRTAQLRANAHTFSLKGESAVSFTRLARRFKVADVAVATTDDVFGPVVLGIRRPLLLLPCTMLPDATTSAQPGEDFEAALAHEFAHLQRHDFAKNLLYELFSLPIAFHPFLWHTRRRIAESRELLCDALAADAVNGPQRYARSLVRLASLFSERTRSNSLHAIGMFDANSFENFERRVMNLTQNSTQIGTARRLVIATLTISLGLGACTSALALRMQVAPPAPQAAQQALPTPAPGTMVLGIPHSANAAPAKIIVADISPDPNADPVASPAPMRVRFLTPTTTPVDATVSDSQTGNATTSSTQNVRLPVAGDIVAGNIESKVTPTYPAEAKEQKISGAVILHAVIAKDGSITSLAVISGPDVLAQSALDAVKQWKYKPYLLNGEPTAVDTTITINFTLAN
jgi:TonB family protein